MLLPCRDERWREKSLCLPYCDDLVQLGSVVVGGGELPGSAHVEIDADLGGGGVELLFLLMRERNARTSNFATSVASDESPSFRLQ